MKTQVLSAFLVFAGWIDAPPFNCLDNSCDKCTSQQSRGFDWNDLEVGDFSFYGGFDFERFTCNNSFGNFQSKYITGGTSSELESCPRASCRDVSSFSIDNIEIAVEFNVDLKFQYGMDDGSKCRQKCSCSSEGTSVRNTQCGGARNVTIFLPNPPPSKPTCSVGIHSIGFHCPESCSSTTRTTSTHKSYSSTTTTPVVKSSSSTPTSIATTSTALTTLPNSTPSTPTSKKSSSSLALSSTASSVVLSNSVPISSTASSSINFTVTASIPKSITTIIVDTTITTCPVTNIYTSGGTASTEITQIVSTLTTTYTSTMCTQCKGSTTSIMSAGSAQSSVSCPSILPSCLNTWVGLVTQCSSINDYQCFCPNSNFTTQVFACLSAHGSSDTEISAAQVYFQGICAKFVPQNPAIVTAASSLFATATITGPVTTISIYTTVLVPGTQSNESTSKFVIVSSAITVPRVVLTSMTGTSVGIYQGTQAQITAAAATAIGTVLGTAIATAIATISPTYDTAHSTSMTTASLLQFTGAALRPSAAFSAVSAAFIVSFFAM